MRDTLLIAQGVRNHLCFDGGRFVFVFLTMKIKPDPHLHLWQWMKSFLLLALSLCAAGCASSSLTTDSGRMTAPPQGRESIAVVPFENLSHSRNAGLIMTDLASSILYTQDRFHVVEVSRLDDDKDAKLRRFDITPWQRQLGVNTAAGVAVGRDLGVDWVLVGSVGEYGFVDSFGETANVGGNLRLVHVSDEQVVWASAFSKRAAVSAFSQDSVHRLTQEILTEQLNRMVREMVEGKRVQTRASQ
ncbi:MAG TPA: hypothetical protein VLU94_00650 [Candidatus Nitrosotalea sp.]|nr:hypothetical protein [Candidatus Nitrosotalea sp.]